MRKFIHWLIEPYQTGRVEITYLKGMLNEQLNKGMKNRLYQLISFNAMILIIHTFLLAMIVTYVVLTFVNIFSFLGIAFIIPIILLLKTFYKKNHMRFRDIYIDKDSGVRDQ
ncbi:hypothetical protein [Aquibacillus kalidii]|uniref:hypothetical protein n=1 Tax=Aquibacillus kalidii TaxID=2762597 RepID=UPI00164545E8|nr:hypothetical protein [Aquibacillus kalidii]